MDHLNVSDCFSEDIFSSSSLDEMVQLTEENYNNKQSLSSKCSELKIIFMEKLTHTLVDGAHKTIFKTELPKLKTTFSDIIAQIKVEIENTTEQNFISDISNLLHLCTDVLSCLDFTIKYVKKEIKHEYVNPLPVVAGEILHEIFEHCKDSAKIYGVYLDKLSDPLMNLFKTAKEIQTSFLNTLNNRIIFDIRLVNEKAAVKNVANILIHTGIIVTELDIKTAAELWKQFVVFTEKYSEILISRIDISLPICFLSTEIINGIETITNTNDDTQTLVKNIKKMGFNLKIIIKLIDVYKANLGEIHNKLLELLIVLNRYSVPVLKLNNSNPKIIDLIHVHLFAGTAPLIKHLIGDRQFVSIYFSNIHKHLSSNEKKLATILLSVQIISKIASSEIEIRKEWLRNDVESNIVHTIFAFLNNSDCEFLFDIPFTIQRALGESSHVSSLYEYLMIHTASIIVIMNPKEFSFIEKLLLKSILQSDIWRAMFATDIWCICARYGNETYCYQQLTTLLSFYEKIQNNTNRPENRYLCHLISRLFSFLSDKCQKEICKKYPLYTYPHLWTILQVFKYNDNFLFISNNDVIVLTDKTIQNINKMMSKNFTIKEFDDTCIFLKLLSTNPVLENIEINQKLTVAVSKLWTLSNNSNLKNSTWYQYFTKIRCDITKNIITVFDSKQLLQILRSIYKLRNDNIEIQIQIPELLKSLSNVHFEKQDPDLNSTFSTIVEIYKHLLNDDDPIVKQKTLESFDHFVHNVSELQTFAAHLKNEKQLQNEVLNFIKKNINDSQEYNEYCKKQMELKFKHKCDVNVINNDEPQRKKLKMSSDVNINLVLERMQSDSSLILDYFRNNTMSNDNRHELVKIVDKIKNVL